MFEIRGRRLGSFFFVDLFLYELQLKNLKQMSGIKFNNLMQMFLDKIIYFKGEKNKVESSWNQILWLCWMALRFVYQPDWPTNTADCCLLYWCVPSLVALYKLVPWRSYHWSQQQHGGNTQADAASARADDPPFYVLAPSEPGVILVHNWWRS